MICGVVDIQIIDGKYGTPKHAIPEYNAVAIGEEDADGQRVHFVAEFNVLDPYYRAYIEHGDSLSGCLNLTYQIGGECKVKQILTFIPPQSLVVVGKGCLCYTRNYTDESRLVDIHYSFVNKRLLHRVSFTLDIESLRETSKIVHALSTDRIIL